MRSFSDSSESSSGTKTQACPAWIHNHGSLPFWETRAVELEMVTLASWLEGLSLPSQGESRSPSQSRRESFIEALFQDEGSWLELGAKGSARPSRDPWPALFLAIWSQTWSSVPLGERSPRSMTATCYSARAYATTGSSPAAQRRADGNASSRCQKPQPLGISVDRRPCPWVSPVGRSLVKTYHNMAP